MPYAVHVRRAASAVLCVLLGGALLAGPAGADAKRGPSRGATVQAGAPRLLPARFFGFNAESIVLPVDAELFANSAELHAKMAAIPTGILRIPGGTTSQWLDWRTGVFITGTGSPFNAVSPTRPAITLPHWAEIVRATGATPLWDLNVFTSTLPDQIAMLKEARRLGMPVKQIELGNELWNPTGPYPARFPTGADYGRAMNPWIVALRQVFPHALIAVSGADETPSLISQVGGTRFTGWNASLLSAVRGEDAIAIHPYWGLPGNATPGSSVPATLTAGPDHWNAFTSSTLKALPKRLKVWLTEWNQIALLTQGGTQIWAQALSVADVAFDHLIDRQVTVSLLHDVVGGASNPQDLGTAKVFPLFTDGVDGSEVLGRTSLGYVMPMIDSTFAGAAVVQRLQVPGAPTVGDQPGVTGVAAPGRRARAVFVNLTAQPVRVRLPSDLGPRTLLTSLAADPASQPGWVPSDQVATANRVVRRTAVLPPYSVDRLAAVWPRPR